MHALLYSEKQRLDILFAKFNDFTEDDELAAHWSRYLCVLLSGFIENTMRILLTSYSSGKAHPYIANYVSKNVSSLTNLNESKLQAVLGSFSENWRHTFEEKVTDEQKDAIDSVLANRHNVVHGRSVGVSPVAVKKYYEKVLEVANLIEEHCIK